jgi:hypothetical protein
VEGNEADGKKEKASSVDILTVHDTHIGTEETITWISQSTERHTKKYAAG